MGADPLFSQDFIKDAGEASLGTVVAAPFLDLGRTRSSSAAEFRRAYFQAYGSLAGPGAAWGYEAVRLIVKAVKASPRKDPESVRLSLAATRNYHALFGPVSFDSAGENTRRAAHFYVASRNSETKQVDFVFRQ